jgi:hypothetical protein
MAAPLSPALTLIADTSAPMELLSVRIPQPLLARLEQHAGVLNAGMPHVARHVVALGCAALDQEMRQIQS